MLPCALYSAPALGADRCPKAPVCDPADPSVCITEVPDGCPVPQGGVLYSPRASAQTTAELEMWPERLRLTVTATADVYRAKLDGERAIRRIVEDASAAKVQAAEDELARAEGWPDWAVALVSFAAGAVLVGGTTIAVCGLAGCGK